MLDTKITIRSAAFACATAFTAAASGQQAPPPTPPPGGGAAPASTAPPPAYGQPPAHGQQPGRTQPVYADQPAHAQQPGGASPPGYGSAPPPAYGAPPPPLPTPKEPRKPGEIFLALGVGDAVCDDEDPEGGCPIDGAFAFGIGGGWRFQPHASLGGDLAVWAYSTSDEWQGQLNNSATDLTVTSVLFAPHVRWYWFEEGAFDPYLQGGLGISTLQVTAKDDVSEFEASATGIAFPVAIGLEWLLGERFRLGGQALAFLQITRRTCETVNGVEDCPDPTGDDNALPWRLVAVGTFLLGS